ncbi:MAG: Coenzyme F420 hydrogenase/dehydrogenase, beta subunit C-terminal domain [Promethearchaeota archaeon]
MVEPNSPPRYVNEEKCLECGICYLICPQTHVLDDNLNEDYNFTNFSAMPFGFYDNIYSCQATAKDFLKYGTDGGVVNSIINYLLEKKLIDGAIVAKSKGPFSREATIARSKEDLIEASGIRLDLSSQLNEIQKFHTYTHSIPQLRYYKFKKLAVVGTPCQIYTIRCMQSLGIIPSQNIELCLGLFCYENFFFDELRMKTFQKEFKIKLADIKKINIKEDLILELKNKKVADKIIHIPFEKLKNYMRSACLACSDFTNIYADISFGGLGSPDKFTTVITRTKKGANIIRKAMDLRVIKSISMDKTSKNKMKEILAQFCQYKINRFGNFVNNKMIAVKSPSLTSVNDKD